MHTLCPLCLRSEGMGSLWEPNLSSLENQQGCSKALEPFLKAQIKMVLGNNVREETMESSHS